MPYGHEINLSLEIVRVFFLEQVGVPAYQAKRRFTALLISRDDFVNLNRHPG